MKFFIVTIILLSYNVCYSQHVTDIKIWLNAFIPDKISVIGGSDFTQTINGGEFLGKTGISGPASSLGTTLSAVYLTDQRGFSNDITAKSRIHSEVSIDIVNNKINIGTQKCDSTVSLNDFNDGAVKCRDLANSSDLKIANQKFIALPNGEKQFEFSFVGNGKNPCFQTSVGSPAPDIDYSIDVKVEIYCDEIVKFTVSGRVEVFPAFEMYASVNGNIQSLMQLMPDNGATPSSLYGPASRLLTDQLHPSIPVIMGSNLNGTWQSNDINKRFTLKITDDKADWAEKNPETGIVVTRSVVLSYNNGQLKLERSNNDVEILRMLGYSPDVYTKVVQSNPNPSFINFCISNGVLNATWNGLYVIKDTQGNFKNIIQPGIKPAKSFTFIRQ